VVLILGHSNASDEVPNAREAIDEIATDIENSRT